MDIQNQEKELIEKLNMVREAFKAQVIDLKYSIRKDIVVAELRDMLANNTDFYSLKNALEEYYTNLIDSIKQQEVEKDDS